MNLFQHFNSPLGLFYSEVLEHFRELFRCQNIHWHHMECKVRGVHLGETNKWYNGFQNSTH